MSKTTAAETMTAAIKAADALCAETIRAHLAPLPHITCRRCEGRGYGYWMGADRAAVPCNTCNGACKVLAPTVRSSAQAFMNAANVVRLRASWVAVREALRAVRADDSQPAWAKEAEIEELSRRLDSLAREGKALAAK